MFYRLLGKLFFLFWICPAISRTMHVVNDHLIMELTKWSRAKLKKMDEEVARSRRAHPAGSRRPE